MQLEGKSACVAGQRGLHGELELEQAQAQSSGQIVGILKWERFYHRMIQL